MILLKLLSAAFFLFVQEVSSWILGKSFIGAFDEWMFRNFRSAVVSAYDDHCSFPSPSIKKNLRRLKAEMLKLEGIYKGINKLIHKDLLEHDLLRYCDEREAIEQAVKATRDFSGNLLALVHSESLPCNAWENRKAVAVKLLEIWEAWLYEKLPIEVIRVLNDEEGSVVDSERLLEQMRRADSP